MEKTLLSLFGVCLAATVGELLLPRAPTTGTKRLLRFLTVLTVLCIILTPFPGVLKKWSELLEELPPASESETDFEQVFADAITAQSAKDLEKGLRALLCERFGGKEEDYTVLASFTGEGELVRVCVLLSGEALTQNPIRIERMLAELLHCEVEVR